VQPIPDPESKERRFTYSETDPWFWIPGTWIHAGAVFVAEDGRFYRFEERTDDGWKCYEVPRERVASPAQLTRIDELRSYYRRAAAARDELDARVRNEGDTPEARGLLKGRDDELERLREELILLCNARTLVGRRRSSYAYDWRKPLLVAVAVIFVLSWVWCVRTLVFLVPEQATGILATILAVISGTVLFVIGAQELSKRRDRLVKGNLVGCLALITLLVIGGAFVVMIAAVMLHYRSGLFGM
jgi:hypothetical protein